MSYFFDISNSIASDKTARKTNTKLVKELTTTISKTRPFDSKTAYNNILRDLIAVFKKNTIKTPNTSIFENELAPIKNEKPLTEKTLWGGVSLKKVDVNRNFIQKFLVIKKHGILGFEIHKQKLENLEVLEGVCLVLFSNHTKPDWQKGKVSVKLATANDKFTFQPNDEHGMITLTNCVIEETSTNHLDDLAYIFQSQQVI